MADHIRFSADDVAREVDITRKAVDSAYEAIMFSLIRQMVRKARAGAQDGERYMRVDLDEEAMTINFVHRPSGRRGRGYFVWVE